MKKHLLAGAVALAFLFTHVVKAAVADLNDLNYWGSGGNRSALVIDWNDGKTHELLVWGYYWSGSSTVQDMLTALAAADPRLFLRVDSNASYGYAVFGIGYQTGGAAFGLTGAQDPSGNPVTPSFPGGIDDMNVTNGVTDAPASSSTVAPVNATDHYGEAWNDWTPPHNRYWGFSLGGSSNTNAQASFTYPTTWTDAILGISSVNLIHEGWYALSFSDPNWTPVSPGTSSEATAAVPEPAAVGLLGLGFVWLAAARRRRL